MDHLNHLGWVVYKSYEIGGYIFGIRTNSELAGEWLEATLAAYESDEEAEPYYSLWVPEEQKAVGKQYHVLYRESDDLMRTTDPARLAQRLLAEVEAFTLRRRQDGLFLDACVVERGGLAALVPSPIVPFIRLAGRRVEQELTLPVEPIVGVDPDGTLFAVPRKLHVPDGACEDLAWRLGIDGSIERSEDVPASVDAVCAFHYDPDSPPMMPISRAVAVHAFAGMALNLYATRGQGLLGLAKLAERLPCYVLQEAKPRESFALLTSLLSGEAGELAAVGSGT